MEDIGYELTDWRYEVKFVLNEIEIGILENWMFDCAFLNKSYENRIVNSIYFDDIERSAVRDNLAGVSDRKKTRIRSYGNEIRASRVVCEKKIKNGRLGRKKRVDLGLIELGAMENQSDQHIIFVPKFDSVQARSNDLELLEPTVIVQYEREYFNLSMGLRMTVDQSIKTFNVYPEQNVFTHSRKPSNETVVEFKCSVQQKEILGEVIASFPFSARRHSKYMAGSYYLGQSYFV